MTTFTAGQKVTFQGMDKPATVISGPHESPIGERWLVEKADSHVTLVRAGVLGPVDDKRQRVAEILYQRLGMFTALSKAVTETQARYLAAADAVLAELGTPAKPGPLAKGDKIRILKDRLEAANVSSGDVLTVVDPDVRGDGSRFTTNAPKASTRSVWYFDPRTEGTGWERA